MSNPVAASIQPQASLNLFSDKLTVLVLPFIPVGFVDVEFFCDGLTLNLMRALAASGQARVVPWATANWLTNKTGDKREYYLATNADVMLEPLVQRDSESRYSLSVQWIDGPTGLLDDFHNVRGGPSDSLSMISDLASKLAHRLSITYDERTHNQVAVRQSSDIAASLFYVRARREALVFTPVAVRRSLEFVNRAVDRDPYFAAAHALLAGLDPRRAMRGLARIWDTYRSPDRRREGR